MSAAPRIGRGGGTLDGRLLAVPRERLSALAALPHDVIDPLLWRLAFDVAAAHQPNERGNCRNLQCLGQRGMCAAARCPPRDGPRPVSPNDRVTYPTSPGARDGDRVFPARVRRLVRDAVTT